MTEFNCPEVTLCSQQDVKIQLLMNFFVCQEPPKPQKEQPPLPCSDGEFQAREGKMQNVQTSTRVTNPPGGKTHKLW